MPKKAEQTVSGLSKEEIDDMIDKAVKAAVKILNEELMKHYDREIELLKNTQSAFETENLQLKATVSDLENKLDGLMKKVNDQSILISQQKVQITEALQWANKNEQYSRRNNLKIHGLKVEDKTSYRLAVSNMLNNKLGIHLKENDILVAHPVASRRPRQAEGDSPSPPIIVSFSAEAKDRRYEAIARRKQLKNTGIVVYEDLTQLNLKLINRLKSHQEIKAAFSLNGKIIGVTNTDKKIHFDPYDDIPKKIAENSSM